MSILHIFPLVLHNVTLVPGNESIYCRKSWGAFIHGSFETVESEWVISPQGSSPLGICESSNGALFWNKANVPRAPRGDVLHSSPNKP